MNGTLSGQKYADFYSNNYKVIGRDVFRNLQIWYQHNGCPAHNACVVHTVLHEIFLERWIGRRHIRYSFLI